MGILLKHARSFRILCQFSFLQQQSSYALPQLHLQSISFIHAANIKSNKFSLNKVSIYLKRARLIDSIRLGLRSSSSESVVEHLNHPALDSFVVANALSSAPSPESALFLIEALKTIPHFSHTQFTLYALAKILAKSRQTARLKALINAISSGKFKNVLPVSFMDRMRWFAVAEDLDSALSVWREWRASKKRPCTKSYCNAPT